MASRAGPASTSTVEGVAVAVARWLQATGRRDIVLRHQPRPAQRLLHRSAAHCRRPSADDPAVDPWRQRQRGLGLQRRSVLQRVVPRRDEIERDSTRLSLLVGLASEG
jgi:hypothetical protein